MPEPNCPLKIFLCHARLTKDGVDRYTWLGKAKLLSGQDWQLEIRKIVYEAPFVLGAINYGG